LNAPKPGRRTAVNRNFISERAHLRRRVQPTNGHSNGHEVMGSAQQQQLQHQ
jgi:hypothetical protein